MIQVEVTHLDTDTGDRACSLTFMELKQHWAYREGSMAHTEGGKVARKNSHRTEVDLSAVDCVSSYSMDHLGLQEVSQFHTRHATLSSPPKLNITVFSEFSCPMKNPRFVR